MAGEPLVTVLVPTHDHGPTLRFSVASALAQTVDDLELFIVGDGMPHAAAEVARELEREQERVRVFEFEKGERHGEAHRHAVLTTEARGRYVLYLSDDDLWLPEHIESLLPLLERADVVAATAATADLEGRLRITPHDLGRDAYRRLHLGEHNRAPLSSIAHTAAAYADSPGWRPTPAGTYTDHYFLKGLLERPERVAASCLESTWLNFPSPVRADRSLEERSAELERWWRRVADPAERGELDRELDAAWRRAVYEFDELAINLTEAYEAHERMLAELRRRAETAEHDAWLARGELEAVRSTRGWRALEALRAARARLARQLRP